MDLFFMSIAKIIHDMLASCPLKKLNRLTVIKNPTLRKILPLRMPGQLSEPGSFAVTEIGLLAGLFALFIGRMMKIIFG